MFGFIGRVGRIKKCDWGLKSIYLNNEKLDWIKVKKWGSLVDNKSIIRYDKRIIDGYVYISFLIVFGT